MSVPFDANVNFLLTIEQNGFKDDSVDANGKTSDDKLPVWIDLGGLFQVHWDGEPRQNEREPLDQTTKQVFSLETFSDI